jgi:hypothetical protein
MFEEVQSWQNSVREAFRGIIIPFLYRLAGAFSTRPYHTVPPSTMKWPPWNPPADNGSDRGQIRRFVEVLKSGDLFTADVLLSPEV